MKRLTVTIPKTLAKKLEQAVKKGRAKNASALITDALDRYLEEGALDQLLAEMDEKFGPPDQEAKEWAERVWREAKARQERPQPSSSTQEPSLHSKKAVPASAGS